MFYKKIVYAALSALVFENVVSVRGCPDEFVDPWIGSVVSLPGYHDESVDAWMRHISGATSGCPHLQHSLPSGSLELMVSNIESSGSVYGGYRGEFIHDWRERISRIARSSSSHRRLSRRNLVLLALEVCKTIGSASIQAPTPRQQRRIYDLCCWFADDWSTVGLLILRYIVIDFDVRSDDD
jgi:hypothetical protein